MRVLEWIRHVVHHKKSCENDECRAKQEASEREETRKFIETQHEYLSRMEDEIAVLLHEDDNHSRGNH